MYLKKSIRKTIKIRYSIIAFILILSFLSSGIQYLIYIPTDNQKSRTYFNPLTTHYDSEGEKNDYLKNSEYKEDFSLRNFELRDEIIDMTFQTQIFGYKLKATDNVPIIRDENGVFEIIQVDKELVNIMIYTKFGSFNYYKLNIKEEISNKTNANLRSFEIEDIYLGCFMEITVTTILTLVDIAFDNMTDQFCYNGILNKNYDDFFNISGEVDDSSQNATDFQGYNAMLAQDLVQQIKKMQMENIIISKYTSLDNKDSNVLSLNPVTFTYYGVAHEMYDVDNNHNEDKATYLRKIPPNYWVPASKINIGIYRWMPSEAQIKSDLQYYNKDYIQAGQGYVSDILAYNMITHDLVNGPEWEVFTWTQVLWWWYQYSSGCIYADEISALWYHSYDPGLDIEIDVYPHDSIIFAHTCYGWFCGDCIGGDPRGPTMAHAFCDYGASAFIGCEIEAPIYYPDTDIYPDPARSCFWQSLCYWDDTVGEALDYYCTVLSVLEGYDVSPYWHIMGNSNKHLSN